VANAPVPGVPCGMSNHHCEKPQSDCSYLEWHSPAHSYVLMSWEFSLCGYMAIIQNDTKDASQLARKG
jgi:hypothetical protein